MQITIAQIKKIAPGAPDKAAGEFVDTFNKWSDKFGITTPLRAAHFISQCVHECAEMKAFEENNRIIICLFFCKIMHPCLYHKAFF